MTDSGALVDATRRPVATRMGMPAPASTAIAALVRS
jgi:hypothetical protein